MEQQGWLGLFVFGAGFSVIAFGLLLFVLVKAKVIKFNKDKPHVKPTSEPFKEFIRAQSAETRKVVYELRNEITIHQAKEEVTFQHLEKGITKMVDVLQDMKTEISKSLNGKSKS